MSVSREVYDYDRTTRQKYHEKPCPYDTQPNLSERELISERTRVALQEEFSLFQIPPNQEISIFVRKWMEDETTRALFKATNDMSSWAIQTEGCLGRATGEFLITSRQHEWGTKELMLTAAGLALVLKAVKIESGMLYLENLDKVDEDILRKAGEKMRLPSDYYSEHAIKGNTFPVFPEGQTILNTLFTNLAGVVCQSDTELLAFEMGASGMYYMIEAAEESLQREDKL